MSYQATGAPIRYEAAGPRSRLAIPRTRGVITGVCLVVLGAWGALVPFVGPYFNYAYRSDQTWHFTYGRLWLDILPGVVTVLAGLLLIVATSRATALFAGWLAALAGAWFVIGPGVSRLWNHGATQTGHPLGGYVLRTVEQLGYFDALGAAIMLLAAFAIGRASVLAARDVLAPGRRRGGFGSGAARVAPASATSERSTRAVGGRRPLTREEAVGSQQPPADGATSGGDAPA